MSEATRIKAHVAGAVSESGKSEVPGITQEEFLKNDPAIKAAVAAGELAVVAAVPNKEIDIKNMPDKTISACMIVKDEEDCIEQCLDSIINYVDEIIFLDTGSTDRTLEIAGQAKYKEKIKILTHYAWEDDFSKARNEACKHATCEYIMTIDADEYLEEDSAKKLQLTLKQYNAFIGIIFQVVSTGPTMLDTTFPSARVYRRDAGLTWGSAVHNQLSIEGIACAMSELRIVHVGYDLAPAKMEKKHNRTVNLLKTKLKEYGDNAFTHCDLARSYAAHGDWYDAIYHAEKSLDIAEENYIPISKTNLLYNYHLLWCCYQAVGDPENALCSVTRGIRKRPDNPDFWHDMCLLQKNYGHNKVAKFCAEEFVKCGKDYMQNNITIACGVVTLYNIHEVIRTLDLRKVRFNPESLQEE